MTARRATTDLGEKRSTPRRLESIVFTQSRHQLVQAVDQYLGLGRAQSLFVTVGVLCGQGDREDFEQPRSECKPLQIVARLDEIGRASCRKECRL